MKITGFLSMLTFGLGTAAAVVAHAATFLPHDLRGQTQASQLVLEGRIERVYGCPDPASGFPRTCGLVVAKRFLKGNTSTGKVILLLPGGTLPDGGVVRMGGAPVLKQGEVVLLSATVMSGSDQNVALTNFDTALLRRVPTELGGGTAADAVGRPLLALPLDGRPSYVPRPQPSTVADSSSGAPPAPPPLSWAVMTWEQAVSAVAAGLTATASTSSSIPGANIRGAN